MRIIFACVCKKKKKGNLFSGSFIQRTCTNKIFKHKKTLPKRMVPVSTFNRGKEHYIKLCLSENSSLKG